MEYIKIIILADPRWRMLPIMTSLLWIYMYYISFITNFLDFIRDLTI